MTAEERGGKRVMNSKMNGTVDLCKTSLLQLSSRFEECKIFEPGWDVLHHQATFLLNIGVILVLRCVTLMEFT